MTSTSPAPILQRVGEGATVELIDVVKEYGSSRALNELSLTIKPGEFIALLGPSGCGKTTALRSLAGLEQINSGSIRIDGIDVASTPVNKRDIGMVFQQYSLFPHMTVQQNVEFGLQMRKVDGPTRKRRAMEALEMVSLDHLAARYAHQLSGGQQQRVALARALVTRPRVLLLDEPLSALDAKVRVSLREEIRRIQTELGITTLFVTHDQEEALAVADRVAVMRAGEIEQIGSPEDLYLTPATSFVADFVGVSNRMRGTLTSGVVTVRGAQLPSIDRALPDGDVLAYVRPEDIVFVDLDSPEAATAIHGTVASTSFLGSLRRTTVRLDDDDTIVSVQHGVEQQFLFGDKVALRLTGRPVASAPVPVAAAA